MAKKTNAKNPSKGRGGRIALGLLAGLLVLALLQSLPIWLRANPGMETLDVEGLRIRYDAAAADGAQLAAARLPEALAKVRSQLAQEDEPVTLYLYEKQSSLHLRKYGLVTLLLAPEWYVGDNAGDVAMAVSPKSKLPGFTQHELLQVAVHEVVHAYNHRTNSKLSYFLDNGAACYLAEQAPGASLRSDFPDFPFALTQTEDERLFGESGGYGYAYLYVEFLDMIYGWDAVTALLAGADYVDVFGMGEEALYEEWMLYMDLYHPGQGI